MLTDTFSEVRAQAGAENWRQEPLTDLIGHIKSTHHSYTRQAIARLGPLLATVCAAHSQDHPELLQIQAAFDGLAEELTAHLMKEEVILFPYIVRMEEAVMEGQRVMRPPFGTVGNPISMMIREHDGAGNALRRMRQASEGYAVPAGVCPGYQDLYQALADLETDLLQHIHLENDILFPRAVEMETRAR